MITSVPHMYLYTSIFKCPKKSTPLCGVDVKREETFIGLENPRMKRKDKHDSGPHREWYPKSWRISISWQIKIYPSIHACTYTRERGKLAPIPLPLGRRGLFSHLQDRMHLRHIGEFKENKLILVEIKWCTENLKAASHKHFNLTNCSRCVCITYQ